MNYALRLLCVLVLGLTSLGVWAQQDQSPAESTTAPDNTKVNKRDRDPGQATADQQSNSQGDRDLTRQIRQAIVKDKSLSSYAHNIKVITLNGEVTLKGPVNTEEEKQAIGAKAAEVVGNPDKVHNQIEVTGGTGKPSPGQNQ